MFARPIARSTVWNLKADDLVLESVKNSIKSLDQSIHDKIGDHLDQEVVAQAMTANANAEAVVMEEYDTDDEPTDFQYALDDQEEYTPETFDGYLTASVMLPRGGKVLKAQVVARKRDSNGNSVGHANSNPILDTRECEVEF